MSNDNQASPSPAAQTQRKRWLAIVVGAVAAIGIAYGAYVPVARSAYTRPSVPATAALAATPSESVVT